MKQFLHILAALQAKTPDPKPAPSRPSRGRGLTHVAAGLTRLTPGLKVKTHIKAGCSGGCQW
jgi:hypothetical protein